MQFLHCDPMPLGWIFSWNKLTEGLEPMKTQSYGSIFKCFLMAAVFTCLLPYESEAFLSAYISLFWDICIALWRHFPFYMCINNLVTWMHTVFRTGLVLIFLWLQSDHSFVTCSPNFVFIEDCCVVVIEVLIATLR